MGRPMVVIATWQLASSSSLRYGSALASAVSMIAGGNAISSTVDANSTSPPKYRAKSAILEFADE